MKNEINILYFTMSLILAAAVAPSWKGSDHNRANETRAKQTAGEQDEDRALLARVNGPLSENPASLSQGVAEGVVNGLVNTADFTTTAEEIARNVAELK